MSNNIYDILKKFNNLDSVKNVLTEGKKVCESCGKAKCGCMEESKGSKPDFLDMDKDGDTKEPMKKAAKEKSKGAVAEAVAQVEKQLNEKYMGFKKTVNALKDQGGIENPEGLAASIGRKKYGKEKFQKAAAAGKKLGEGDYQGDKPGQTNFKPRSPYEPSSTPDQERAAMYKKNNIPPEMQANNSPAYQNWRRDRDAAISRGEIVPSAKTNEGDYNEDMLSPGQKKIARMSPPPDKIDANDLAALRAGKKKKAEGAGTMHFKSQQAQADGKDSFELGGKTYPVQEGMHFNNKKGCYVYDDDTGRVDKEDLTPQQLAKIKQWKAKNPGKRQGAVQTGERVPYGSQGIKRFEEGKVQEGFPTTADSKKRMDDREGKTAHGKKTATKTGMKHERDWDKEETGERGRPVKDKFAKKK
jgi:hypothetical protein